MTRPLGRILIADRFVAVRRGVRSLIEGLDYFRVVAETENGRDALALALETRPNIAIVDYALPELGGPELIHRLRAACPQTEILIYADVNRENIVLESLRNGARGLVCKADPEHHLLAALNALTVRRPYFSESFSGFLLDRLLRSKSLGTGASLTHREREIVQLIAEGYLNKQIASRLNISIKTVETHRAGAMSKLELRTTADLVRYAIRNDIAQA